MGFYLLLLPLLVCLPAALPGIVRQMDDYQSIEERPCDTYTNDGLLHVDCSDRGLTDLPNDIDNSVQILDLSNNALSTYPLQLENFSNLQKLDFSGNMLAQPLPLYFENLGHLHTLNLSNNDYKVWLGSLRHSSIKILDLSKNKINNIDAAAMNSMPNLNHLDLNENRIYELPERMFEYATNLDVIILSRNYFSDVPRFQSNSLRSLYLSNCQITTLRADSLQGMNSLLVLDLSINQIERVPDNLASTTLQELDLSYNEIGALSDFTFSSLPHLAVLNLRGNEFREVWPTSHFASNPFLREVHVKGNRWTCDGFSVNLLLTYEFLSPKVGDAMTLMCYSPSNVTQMSWQEAYIRTWHSNDSVESYTVVAVMVGIIIGILITSCVCRAMMALNKPDPPPLRNRSAVTTNLNGMATQPRAESIEIRVPLREDLPPSYDEALLMPRLDSSFHSLPDFVDEEQTNSNRRYRRSRSFGDLTSERPRDRDRRSVRRTVEIHIT